ncbi:MAG TPA: ATP synthase F1 subunit gamma [Vicinamibacterales bacterium]|nr:ATP synthase F1 subunit gamma [Vicinamibacterales bacterium]
MPSTRDLRRRIISIRGTAQITRAMQMVASSKMRKAQEAAILARPFARLLYEIQRKVTTRPVDFQDPLMEVRDVQRRAVILVAADKGLCGALNTNVLRLASEFDPATTVFITAGRKAAQFVAVTRRKLVAEFAYGDAPTYGEARAIAATAQDMFLSGEVDRVHLVATRFINTLKQEPTSVEILPIGALKGLRSLAVEEAERFAVDRSECLFEPSPQAIISAFLPRWLTIFVYLVLLNAKASEQSARMVSMKNATEAAESLIDELKLEYNRLRQGNITKELLEIAGGQAE